MCTSQRKATFSFELERPSEHVANTIVRRFERDLKTVRKFYDEKWKRIRVIVLPPYAGVIFFSFLLSNETNRRVDVSLKYQIAR